MRLALDGVNLTCQEAGDKPPRYGLLDGGLGVLAVR